MIFLLVMNNDIYEISCKVTIFINHKAGTLFAESQAT